jgi:CarD family transcriptional regulator
MFNVGDTVFHPSYGAGVVVEIKKRNSLGSGKRYYSVELLCQPKTLIMVPVQTAEDIGLRPSTPQSELPRVWRVLGADPTVLPQDHSERYELLRDRLHGGDVLQIAAAVRDMAWRDQNDRGLTKQGQRLYQEGMMLLAGEVAVVQGSDYEVAEAQIAELLRKSLPPA